MKSLKIPNECSSICRIFVCLSTVDGVAAFKKVALGDNVTITPFGAYLIQEETATSLPLNITVTGPLTWTGLTDSSWNYVYNWTPRTKPTESTDVVIPANPSGSRFPILASGTNKACNITFEPGAELGRQDLLTYTNAFVQYGLNYTPQTWLILSRWTATERKGLSIFYTP
ncbi:MAG: hypothetical protein LBD45_05740 [Bacteroidales bacterium]|nr:hypothetical protein [Bacteroidales bacterium]